MNQSQQRFLASPFVNHSIPMKKQKKKTILILIKINNIFLLIQFYPTAATFRF